MKKTIMAMLVALCVTAVSCEQAEPEIVIPVFPELQKLAFNENNNVQEMSFTANTDWTLVSPVVWCKFIDGNNEESNSVSGAAGECKIKIKVTEEGQLVGEEGLADKTSIEMIMKDQKKPVAEIIRSAKGFVFHLLDEKGAPVELANSIVEVGYEDYIPFSVQANFPFMVTRKPEWIEFADGDMRGAVNQVVTGKVRIVNNDEREKYEIQPSDSEVITFADKEGKAFFNVKLHYAGMPAGWIEITSEGSRTDWIVSEDGITFTQKSINAGMESGDLIIENELPFTVKTRNDDFKLIALEELAVGEFYCSVDEDPSHPVDWLQTTVEKGKVLVSATATDTDRTGWLFAVPSSKEINAENWWQIILKDNELNMEEMEPYLLGEFSQKLPVIETPEAAISVTDGMGMPLPVEVLTDPGICNDYGVSEVYVVRQTQTPMSFNIDPMISGEYDCMAWLGDVDKTDALDFSYGIPNYWLEETLEEGQQIEILFQQNMVNVKVLLIQPESAASAPVAMKVTDMMGKALPVEKLTGDWLLSEYGIDEVYSVRQTQTPMSFNIDPMLEGDYECSAWLGDINKTDALDFSYGIPNYWSEDELTPGQSVAINFIQNEMIVKILLIEPVE